MLPLPTPIPSQSRPSPDGLLNACVLLHFPSFPPGSQTLTRLLSLTKSPPLKCQVAGQAPGKESPAKHLAQCRSRSTDSFFYITDGWSAETLGKFDPLCRGKSQVICGLSKLTIGASCSVQIAETQCPIPDLGGSPVPRAVCARSFQKAWEQHGQACAPRRPWGEAVSSPRSRIVYICYKTP